jgi:hypothetical protein
LSKISREIPKAIASFGEKQFKETGASLVEVLRVKEVVLRKHFQQLKGILYLVAVVSHDRVRVYFFNAAGIMVIGENLEPTIYDEVRKSSRLVAKYEKPRPLTPEELRIEATQDMRDALGKAIRRVSRMLALKEPEFPDIFVTRTEKDNDHQRFGIQINEEKELVFEEAAISKSWNDGLLLRAAFLLHFEKQQWNSDFISLVGNGLALSLLKGEARTAWYNEWKKRSKGSIWETAFNHLAYHATTYTSNGYSLLTSLLSKLPLDLDFSDWQNSVQTIHDSLTVSLGTEDYHVIDGFCKTLRNPQQLIKRRHLLESIHLSPRSLCNPLPLGIRLSVAVRDKPDDDSWASIRYIEGSISKSLEIIEQDENTINSIQYWLNLDDVFPLRGGPLSHGQSIIRQALERIGIHQSVNGMYEANLELNEKHVIEQKEIAVLKRLILGDLTILSNTLVGSPLIVRNLTEKGIMVLLPDFNHLGINHDFLIMGSIEKIRLLARLTSEATILNTDDFAYAILSAPTTWKRSFIEAAIGAEVSIWPIISTRSSRRFIRSENTFPLGDVSQGWTEATTL